MNPLSRKDFINHDCKQSRDSGCSTCDQWFNQLDIFDQQFKEQMASKRVATERNTFGSKYGYSNIPHGYHNHFSN